MDCGGTTPLSPARHVSPPQSADVSALSIPVSQNQLDLPAFPHSAETFAHMNWPHAPKHWLFEPGIYMVTAGTYQRVPHLNSSDRLDFFLEALFTYAEELNWSLRAWAVMANHYHFVASSPVDPGSLRKLIGKLHMKTAQELNRQDATPGRKVWFQYWDSHITFESSYLARLHYVHSNPAKHGVAHLAENYKWCSASWFARSASPAFVATVKSCKTDRLEVPDDF